MLDNFKLISIILIVVILLIILCVVLKSKKGTKKSAPVISSSFLNNLESLVGGRSNVNKVSKDGGRVKFELGDIKKADLKGMKDIAKSGLMVSGNTVKILFTYSTDGVIAHFN